MVIDDFYFCGFVVRPAEADSIVIIDRNTPLTVAIAGRTMEAVASWRSETLGSLSCVQSVEAPSGFLVELAWEGLTGFL
jgi:hypothetical protein